MSRVTTGGLRGQQKGWSLRGDKEFRAVLKKLRAPELDQVNEKALKKVGRAIQHRARHGYLSGNPLRKITSELFDSVEAISTRPEEYIRVGSPLDQAMPLHFGWPGHNLRPHPWLFPAAEDVIPDVVGFWIVELERSVEGARV